jgi:hypothetical protein
MNRFTIDDDCNHHASMYTRNNVGQQLRGVTLIAATYEGCGQGPISGGIHEQYIAITG